MTTYSWYVYESRWLYHEHESLYNLFYIYVCFDWNNTLNDVINLDRIIFDIFILKHREVFLNPFVWHLEA